MFAKMSSAIFGLQVNDHATDAYAPENPNANILNKKRASAASDNSETPVSIVESKTALVAIQWFVAIGTSYLVLFGEDGATDAPLRMLLIFLCLLSAPVVQRLPDRFFQSRLVESRLLILDSILILAAVSLSQTAPWDLLVLFFFCVFIAATGENLMHIVLGCTLLSIVFLIYISAQQVEISAIRPELLVRVPFMLGISVFYGHLMSQIKREQKRIRQLKEEESMKRQLVCALAHDVKAPLSVILGHAELLAGCFGGRADPKEQASSLKTIRENIDRIARLVTGFLNVSKVVTETEDTTRDWVDINAIATEIMRQQAVPLRKKQITLTLALADDLKPCCGDQEQLERALWNLVDNAIKFTPPGGAITLTSRMTEDRISVSVQDSGMGIPKEELPSLFVEFQRLKGAANTEGTGLGLFIVKNIIEAHDGEITVESEDGAGTCFNISLPTRTEEHCDLLHSR